MRFAIEAFFYRKKKSELDMILSITYIELKRPIHFFSLSYQAMKIVKQLKNTSCKKNKNVGFWKKHFTMTLWEDEKSMKDFVRSGAHLDAMKNSYKIAKEIKVLTIESDTFLSWKEAKKRVLEQKNVLAK